MRIKAYKRFKEAYRDLPKNIQRKTDRQLSFLTENIKHPSLHTKKIKGKQGIWEARINLHYRLTFEFAEETIFLRVVGNHNEVLKNP